MHESDLTFQISGELSKLKELGVDDEQLNDFQVLLLPENVFTFKHRADLHEAGDSLTLAKLLRQQGVRCATTYDLGLDIPVLERRSRDQWLGTIWIRDFIAVPFVVGVLSSLVATGVSDAVLQPKVHADVYIQRGANVTKFSYTGDGKTFVEMLNAIKEK
jgi:hypothetical protein